MFLGKTLLALSVAASLTACGGGGSGTTTAPATVGNQPPIANAGPAQNAVVGAVVKLDGTASSDAENTALTYRWTITAKPGTTVDYLSNATTSKPAFAILAPGTFVASLVVNDGNSDSTPSTVTINASALTGAAPGRAPIQAEIDYLTKLAVDIIPTYLRSPSTFKIIGSPTWSYYDSIGKPSEGAVSLEFDSQNGFGALIRTKAICGAKFDTRGFWTVIIYSDFRICLLY